MCVDAMLEGEGARWRVMRNFLKEHSGILTPSDVAAVELTPAAQRGHHRVHKRRAAVYQSVRVGLPVE